MMSHENINSRELVGFVRSWPLKLPSHRSFRISGAFVC